MLLISNRVLPGPHIMKHFFRRNLRQSLRNLTKHVKDVRKYLCILRQKIYKILPYCSGPKVIKH
jgi:hypothetical protein